MHNLAVLQASICLEKARMFVVFTYKALNFNLELQSILAVYN